MTAGDKQASFFGREPAIDSAYEIEEQRRGVAGYLPLSPNFSNPVHMVARNSCHAAYYNSQQCLAHCYWPSDCAMQCPDGGSNEMQETFRNGTLTKSKDSKSKFAPGFGSPPERSQEEDTRRKEGEADRKKPTLEAQFCPSSRVRRQDPFTL